MTNNQFTFSSVEERFLAKVDRRGDDECWPWLAQRKKTGYGAFRLGGKVEAHRVCYELFVGPVPEGLVLDHLCRNPLCVNPAHLEPVEERVNILRGVSPSALNARKTHCPRGHEYTPENTYRSTKNGRTHRICRACSLERRKRRNAA